MSSKYTISPKQQSKIVHFFTIIISTCILLTITSVCFYNISKQSIKENRLKLIEKGAEITSKKIQLDLYNYSRDSLSRPVSLLNRPASFFNEPEDNTIPLQEIRVDLFNHLQIGTDFNDIVLFRIYDNAFVSASRAGHSLDDTYSQNSTNYADLHELATIPQMSSPIFYRTENSRVYYIYPVYTSNAQGMPYAGFLSIWLDTESFFNLDSVEVHDNGTLLVLYGDDILFSKGMNVLSNEAILKTTDKFSSTGKTTLSETFFSTDYSFFFKESEDHSLTYIYYEPVLTPLEIFFDLKEPAAIMYWICNAIIISLFIFILILRIINPTSNKKLAPNASSYNSGHIFKNALDLLYGNSSLSSLDEALRYILNTNSPYKYTSCIVIEPNPMILLNYTPEQKADFAEGITASVDMHLENTSDIHYALLPYPNNQLTCIINSNNFMPENLALNLLEHLSGVYDCKFNVFCTVPTISLSELSRNYATIIDGQKYSYVYKYNTLLTQDTLEQLETSNAVIDTGLAEKIHSFINNNNFTDLKHYIHSLPSIMRQRGFSYIRIRDHYRTIFNIIHDYCKEKQRDYRYKDMPLSDIINQFESIDECSSFLCEEITNLETYLSNEKVAEESNSTKKYVDHLTEYIDSKILNISLASTAEHFNVSTAHLSRSFKELTGINFSDYVAEQKLQKAAWLLINDKSMPISDIAKNLGYNTPAYFSRKFKERFDVTPAMYRKQHLNEQ